MFEKLVIHNFQKHSRLEINLDEKVTTIVGPSDAGKSAVIRSLRWLCQNSPSGIEFLKNGQTCVSVDLLVDGRHIERCRASANNYYSVDGKDLKAFGQGVPDEVASILNIDDINFQAQHDPPYWLTLTPGEVSRQLNALIDLSIIDDTMKNINRTLSRSRVELELATEKEKKKKEELEELQWVKECQMDANVLKAADKLLAEKKVDLEDLVILSKETASSSVDARQARAKLSAVGEVGKQAAYVRKEQQVLDGVAGVLSAVKTLQGALQFLTVDTAAVDSAKSAVDEHTKSLQSLLRIRNECRVYSPLVENKKVAAAVFKVDVDRSEWADAKSAVDSLQKLILDIKLKNEDINLCLLNLVLAQKDIQEKTGGLCPVCKGPLK